MRVRTLVAALAVTAAMLAAPPAVAGADALDAAQKKAVEEVVREYLRQHPEVVIEAIRAFQAREEQAKKDRTQANLVALRDALEKDAPSPVAGNPDGDVTIVEFFDYRCGFCKKVFPTVVALMKEDRNVRYVFKEFPILGPQSVVAPRWPRGDWTGTSTSPSTPPSWVPAEAFPNPRSWPLPAKAVTTSKASARQ